MDSEAGRGVASWPPGQPECPRRTGIGPRTLAGLGARQFEPRSDVRRVPVYGRYLQEQSRRTNPLFARRYCRSCLRRQAIGPAKRGEASGNFGRAGFVQPAVTSSAYIHRSRPGIANCARGGFRPGACRQARRLRSVVASARLLQARLDGWFGIIPRQPASASAGV